MFLLYAWSGESLTQLSSVSLIRVLKTIHVMVTRISFIIAVLARVVIFLHSTAFEPPGNSSDLKTLSLCFPDPPSPWFSPSLLGHLSLRHGTALSCLLGTVLSVLFMFSQGFELPSRPSLSSHWGWLPRFTSVPNVLSELYDWVLIAYQTSPLWYLTGTSNKSCPQMELTI